LNIEGFNFNAYWLNLIELAATGNFKPDLATMAPAEATYFYALLAAIEKMPPLVTEVTIIGIAIDIPSSYCSLLNLGSLSTIFVIESPKFILFFCI
jgi:hypothetical protein